MVALWKRMRNICPKVNIYHGPILKEDGTQCATDCDLDCAMLATRQFWFETPMHDDDAWSPVLDSYAEVEPWPLFSPPPTAKQPRIND